MAGVAQHDTLTPIVTHQHTTLPEPAAARYIGMSVGYMRHERRCGSGPSYLRLGRAVRYRITDLEAWLEARLVRGEALAKGHR